MWDLVQSVYPLVLVLVVVAVLSIFLKAKASASKSPSFNSSSKSNSDVIRYNSVDSILTQGELAFYDVLENQVGGRATIFSKVRIADILKADAALDKKQKHRLFRKISQKHFDFILCEKGSLRPLCVLELNDKSHKRKDRMERDTFVKEACSSAGLPLYFVTAKRDYVASDIEALIGQHLSEGMQELKRAS